MAFFDLLRITAKMGQTNLGPPEAEFDSPMDGDSVPASIFSVPPPEAELDTPMDGVFSVPLCLSLIHI